MLNSSQAKQLREIAAYLKQKRIEQSISLEQIASRTFIRLQILEALETAEVEQLPELIYVQGFIRRYAEVLHIDGNSLAKQLSQSDSAVAVETPSVPEPQPQPQPKPKPESKVKATEKESLNKPTFQPYWLLIAIVSCLGASIGILYALSRAHAPESASNSVLPKASDHSQIVNPPIKSIVTKPAQPAPKATTSPVAINPASEKTITKPTPSPVATSPHSTVPQPTPEKVIASPSPVASPASSPSTSTTSPLSVAVALDGTSWLKIQVDGKTEYEGILEEGVKQNWTAKEKLTIVAGNAGAVSYSVNQKPVQRLGEIGEVKTIKLTPSSDNPTP